MSLNPNIALTRIVYRNAVVFFTVILLAAFWGFWPKYFSNLLGVTAFSIHMHGIALTLWLVMLVSQGYLIRTNHRALHRKLGKLSYGLAPVVFLSTLGVVHHRFQDATATDGGLLLLGLTLANTLQFGITAGLALYHRSESAIHARYMLCTPLPMLSPIFSRVLQVNFPSFVATLPLPIVDGRPYVALLSILAADAILAMLSIWDWVAHKRLNVFPVMLAVFVAFHVSVYLIYDQPFWESFFGWFSSLR